jgi:hypothetical protein
MASTSSSATNPVTATSRTGIGSSLSSACEGLKKPTNPWDARRDGGNVLQVRPLQMSQAKFLVSQISFPVRSTQIPCSMRRELKRKGPNFTAQLGCRLRQVLPDFANFPAFFLISGNLVRRLVGDGLGRQPANVAIFWNFRRQKLRPNFHERFRNHRGRQRRFSRNCVCIMKHYGMAGWRVKQNYCPLTLLISSKAAMVVVPSKLLLLANCRRILL